MGRHCVSMSQRRRAWTAGLGTEAAEALLTEHSSSVGSASKINEEFPATWAQDGARPSSRSMVMVDSSGSTRSTTIVGITRFLTKTGSPLAADTWKYAALEAINSPPCAIKK